MSHTSRSARVLFDEETTVNAGVTSNEIYLGHSPLVGLVLSNTGAATTVSIEVSTANARSGGLNAYQDDWYELCVPDGAGSTEIVEIAVPPSGAVAYNLSPFAFNMIRLVATPDVPDAQGVISAIVNFGK